MIPFLNYNLSLKCREQAGGANVLFAPPRYLIPNHSKHKFIINLLNALHLIRYIEKYTNFFANGYCSLEKNMI